MSPSVMSDNSDSDLGNSENEEHSSIKPSKTKKKDKRGIIYLSTIPKFMNVTKIREIFAEYGEIDRVFLQPEEQKAGKKKKKKPAKHFTEGWIEFKKKRIAKQVAVLLNNKQIGGRKRSKFYDFIWNVKYLPRFKWVHLSERLAYERAVHKQRMNTEIAQAKREANFFSHNVDVSERLAKRQNKSADTTNTEETASGENSAGGSYVRQYKQRDLDSEIQEKKLKALNSSSLKIQKKKKTRKQSGPLSEGSREDFLKSVFGARS